MKTQLEVIEPDQDSSYHLMVNPNLSDFFYWHFHPELELVYIEGTNGIRHVGDHLTKFKGSDLAFIGSNIPHLNFDYQVKTKYEKRVVHLNPNFLKTTVQEAPELEDIATLLRLGKYGVAFGESAKEQIRDKLMNIHKLDKFERFVELLQILRILGRSNDFELLHEQVYQNQFAKKDQDRLQHIYSFVDNAYTRKIEIAEVAHLCNLTPESFCRFFKKMTKLTFTQFVNHYRINVAKRLLMMDKSVTQVCFESGFESLSYFNRTFKKVVRENPLEFRKRMML